MYCHDSMFIKKKKSAITIVMSLLVVSFIGTVFFVPFSHIRYFKRSIWLHISD